MNSQLWQFELSADKTIGQLHQPSCGAWLALPGAPVNLGPLQLGPVRFDALVQLQQLPIAVGVRLNRQPANLQPMPLCLTMLHAYAHNRSGQQAAVNPGSSELLARWGALGAASALYQLAQPEPSGADTEEVTMFACPGHDSVGPVMWLLLVSKLFNSRALDPIRWSMFNGATMGSLQFDSSLTARPIPRLWPTSTWLRPGFDLVLAPERQELTARLRSLLAAAADDLALLQQRLHMLACGGEPPTQPLDAQMHQVFAQFLGDTCPTEEVRRCLTEALAQVHTTHDLRGLALLGLQAVYAAQPSLNRG